MSDEKTNDCKDYDLDDPDVAKAWDMLMKMPVVLLKRLKKKSYNDMRKKKHGATGTYYMVCDILELKKGSK